MAMLSHALLLALIGMVYTQGDTTAQTPCTPGSNASCPPGQTCNQASVCEIPPTTVTVQSSNMTAFIILGAVLGVVVIIVIVILVVSCGRWNWNWRTAGDVAVKRRKVVKSGRSMDMIRKVRTKKPNLKFGVKNDFPAGGQDNTNGSSKALFVLGQNAPAPDEDLAYRASGPHVARVDLDDEYVPPPPSAQASSSSNPNVSRLGCPDMHHHCPNPSAYNIDAHAQAHAAHVPVQSLYPQLGNVNGMQMVQPQHHINIHAAVPSISGTTIQQVPQAMHHQQLVTQPGLYPQLGHTHAQIHHGGHVHNPNGSQTMLPPAYQTMERTDVKF